jgi:hypothetical protein
VPTDTPADSATSLMVARRVLRSWANSGRPGGAAVPSPLVRTSHPRTDQPDATPTPIGC